MIRKIYDDQFRAHYEYYEQEAIELNYSPDEELIEDLMAEDLASKNFSGEEIDEIVRTRKPSPKSTYKFLAYMLLLQYGDFYTVEDLKELCKEEGTLEQLTDKDLKQILIQRKEINY